ncbi:MAG TPA: serine protease [Lacipirellulaceae bacterium]|nr:serine protease [Lacipirellulaceae bacterium]
MFRHVTLCIVLLSIIGTSAVASVSDNAAPHLASLWPLFGSHPHAVYDSLPGVATPHPAVARIIVPEDDATAFGSGTLVGVHESRGLVITNWHVVRDAVGLVDVVFPDGFHSHAKPLKVDSDWDLAALVIWRPPGVEPVKIATQPPRPGDLLTIHGYGRGKYRIATGHCTAFYSPRPDFPHEIVELDVEARQGDSGGPIFNQAGELAGVLFGAGQGTTLGSFAPRVRVFLASVAPDLDVENEQALAAADKPAPKVTASIRNVSNDSNSTYPSAPWSPPAHPVSNKPTSNAKPDVQLAGIASSSEATSDNSAMWQSIAKNGWYEPLKTLLAAVGLTALVLRLLRSVR